MNTVSTEDDCGIVSQMDELNLSSSGTCMLVNLVVQQLALLVLFFALLTDNFESTVHH